jgi:UPF0755 protein
MRWSLTVRSGTWRRAAGTLALAFAAAGCGGEAPGALPRRVSIPAGATLRDAADSLATAGIISSPRWFRLYTMIGGRDREIRAGTYLLRPGMGWGDLIDDLTRGRGIVHTVTIPEGYSIADIAPLLAKMLSVPEESVMVAVRDSAMRAQMDAPAATLEGYLFPDTYIFPDGTSARTAVAEMTRRFTHQWKAAWDDQLSALAMSRNDIVTLASIVEKEAKLPEERAVISAVYHNRLRKGMLLQADPTVEYGLGHHTPRVLYRDLAVKSPYNTYQHRGLPPGPIASPGSASLEAALFPANVPYLYFVAAPDGHHEFRVTYREHTQATAAVRKAARAGKPR